MGHHVNLSVLIGLLCWKHIIKIGGVNTTSQPKHPNVFGIEETLKKDTTEIFSDNTKEDDSENLKKNLKIIQIQTKKLMDKRWTISYSD